MRMRGQLNGFYHYTIPRITDRAEI